MLGDVPHGEIRRVRDRGWTMRLLDVVLRQDGSEEELGRVVETLRQIEDDRVVEPLRAVLFDRSLESELRDDASSILIASDDAITDAELRGWWRSGDEVIREHALYSMGHDQADIVLAVAGDDEHPQQAAALTAMSNGFDDSRAVDVAIHALQHEDPGVRLAAARQLLWEEPVLAEGPLLNAAEDRAEEEVAAAAIYALSYYTSQRVLLRLSALARRVDGDISESVQEALESLVDEYESSIARCDNGPAIQRLRKWMTPVTDLVSWPAVIEPRRTGEPAQRKPLKEMSEAAVLAAINEPNVPWSRTLRALSDTDWNAFGQGEHERLRAALTQHPSRSVRFAAPYALAAWNDHEALIALANDPSLDVRRHTMEVISKQPPNSAYAAVTWTIANHAAGLQRTNAIHAYARHANPNDAIPRLHALAKSDPSNSARHAAILALTDLGARNELTDLLALLDQPPITNWGVHTALLDSISRLALPAPDLSNLHQIDDLYVAEALSRIKATEPASQE